MEVIAPIYQNIIEKIIKEYSTGPFYREIYNAKNDYFQRYGAVSEDDDDYENQMDLFMGWYLFDRNLTHIDLPPVQLYYRKYQATMPQEELVLCRNLTQAEHSVFEVLRSQESELSLRELATKKKYQVLHNQLHDSFSKDDVFTARVIPTQDAYCFLSGFCFHPRESLNFIKMQLNKVRNQDKSHRDKLLFQLNRMRLKNQRFPHIDIKYIYTLEPKI